MSQVLVIEDNDTMREGIVEILHREGAPGVPPGQSAGDRGRLGELVEGVPGLFRAPVLGDERASEA